LWQIKTQVDPTTDRLVKSMPSVMHSPRAAELGLPRDRSVEEIVQNYVEEFLGDEMVKEYPMV
jgi:hypothetical protein